LKHQISALEKQLALDSRNLEVTQASIREALLTSEQARKTKRDIAG
jgi:hypothetical protein